MGKHTACNRPENQKLEEDQNMSTCSELSDPNWWPQRLYCPQHDTYRYSNNPGKILGRTAPNIEAYNDKQGEGRGNYMDGISESEAVTDDTVSYRSAQEQIPPDSANGVTRPESALDEEYEESADIDIEEDMSPAGEDYPTITEHHDDLVHSASGECSKPLLREADSSNGTCSRSGRGEHQSAFQIFLDEFKEKYSERFNTLSEKEVTQIAIQVWNEMSQEKRMEFQMRETYLQKQLDNYSSAKKDRPGKHKTAYQIFIKDFLDKEYEKRKHLKTTKLTKMDIFQKGVRRWKRMSKAERAVYEDRCLYATYVRDPAIASSLSSYTVDSNQTSD